MLSTMFTTTITFAVALYLSSDAVAFQSTPRTRTPRNYAAQRDAVLRPPRTPRRSPPRATSTPSDAAASAPDAFAAFDYHAQWYPVIWAEDVPASQPVRVALFDVDYVLAKTRQGEEDVFYAMEDRCPHKKVALSEGRITDCGTDDSKYFQCSYHGWTFDGGSGECVEIPQTVIARSGKRSTSQRTDSIQPAAAKRREDATAVAVSVVQGMVWIQPHHTPLEALAAAERGALLPPPRIPEVDLPGYRTARAVRDFPIDWTVLMENIMDPDHGYFAHSSSATGRGFDWYSADGAENAMHVEEEFDSRGGWKISSSVNAVDKMSKYNKEVRAGEGTEGTSPEERAEATPPRLATTTFVAPSLIYMGRRTNATDPSPFVTGFWVCPTGTGTSRFMSAAIGKTPFAIPRWLVHINLNNFLDQDTFLLCGQHAAVLRREAEGHLRAEAEGGGGAHAVRRATYVYRSPSERLGARLGRWFDATLARAPNRREGVLAWYGKHGQGSQPARPRREEVLDRYAQHTSICPDSMDVVRRCDNVIRTSKVLGLALVFMRVVASSDPRLPDSQIPAAMFPVLFASVNRAATCFLRGKRFYSILAIAFLSHRLASRIRKEFFFKFDEDMHRKDIKYIAKNWIDL